MAQLVFKMPVEVQWSKRDRYGRVIGKILVSAEDCKNSLCENKIDAGLFLINQGLAWHYKKYQKEQTKNDREAYSQAELLAREKKIGLWTDANPVAPWDFRHKI